MDKLLLMLIGGLFLTGCSSAELTDIDRKYGYRQVSDECGPITENKASGREAIHYSACESGKKGKNAIPCSQEQEENVFIAKVIPSPSCPVKTKLK